MDTLKTSNRSSAPPSDFEGELHAAQKQWEQHPNYPTQTLLLGSHRNFREFSRRLVADAHAQLESDPHATVDSTTAFLFRHWKSAMHSHERYEEGKLYPFLRARFDISTEDLKAQHASLGDAEEQVYAALESTSCAEVAEALLVHDRVLHAHLAAEECLVIPLLLALTPSEFRELNESSIQQLLRRIKTRTDEHNA